MGEHCQESSGWQRMVYAVDAKRSHYVPPTNDRKDYGDDLANIQPTIQSTVPNVPNVLEQNLAFHKQYVVRMKIAAIAEDFPKNVKGFVFHMKKQCFP